MYPFLLIIASFRVVKTDCGNVFLTVQKLKLMITWF